MGIVITAAQIKKSVNASARNDIVNAVVKLVNDEGNRFFLDTYRRVAEFIGQTAVESGYYTILEERLNYSTKAMRKAWPSRFPTDSSTKPYVNNPRALANFVYGGRMGNRASTNDGYAYRGRGLKQLTGRENYTLFTKWAKARYPDAPDFVAKPELVATFPWAILSAVWFWVAHKVYVYADKDDTVGATKAINGGTNGLKDRLREVNDAKLVLMPKPASLLQEVKPKTGDPILAEFQQKLNDIAEYKSMPEFDVGKVDGWMGTKTDAAVRAFQGSTGKLKIDGVLGDETKKAINKVHAAVIAAEHTDVAEMVEGTTEDVIVEQVPTSIPTKLLDTLNKPIYQDKSIITYVMGGGSIFTLLWNMGVKWFSEQHVAIQMLIICLIAGAVVYAFLAIKDAFRSRKGMKELKANNEDVVNAPPVVVQKAA